MNLKKAVSLLLSFVLVFAFAQSLAAVIVDPEAPVFPGSPDDGLLEIWCGKVNVCDCHFLRCNGETMMIDGGTQGTGAAVKKLLGQLGWDGVDYMLTTHHHDDHMGMQKYLVKHGFPVGEYLTPYPHDYNVPDQREMEKAVLEKGIPYHTIKDGDEMWLGGENGARIQFFRWAGSTNANFSSVMCRVTYGERSMYFLADVTGEAQKCLAQERPDIPWKSDILKTGHHGYKAQVKELLHMISPEFAVITNSKLGAADCIKQYQREEIPFMVTPSGTIYLRTDGGEDWTVTQYKEK